MAERGRILEDDDSVLDVLRTARRVAVVGIKPESHRHTAAHYVPAYLKRAGYEVIPIPTYYPDVNHILAEPVYRRLADVPGDIDLVILFRRSEHVPPHLDDIFAKRPRTVWMQSGIRNDSAAERLIAAGIDVVQDRCAMIEHRAL